MLKEPKPIEMHNTFKKNHEDPLAGFMTDCSTCCMTASTRRSPPDTASMAMAGGLCRTSCFFAVTAATSRFARRIAAVESREGKMGVWRKGMDEPYVGFPINGRNVWLLRRLVQSRLKEDEQSNEPPKDGLGPNPVPAQA